MKVEHIAFVVDDPDVVAKWYCDNLGMRVVRQGPPPIKMTFLADSEGQTMYELYAQPEVETPDLRVDAPPRVAFRVLRRRPRSHV